MNDTISTDPSPASGPNPDPNASKGPSTIDPAEIEKFSQIAAEWWDPLGKFRPLHKFNPVRLAFIRDTICLHYGREPRSKKPLEGLSLVDIGCGGGLVCEPMARLGATVTGVDAAERNIQVAALHAKQSGLNIDYRATTVENLAQTHAEQYDIVLNLEAVEHVADRELFLVQSAALLKPGGIMIVATINRTVKAFALAKVGVEYVLRWLPRGTHDPRKFVKPEEIAAALQQGNMTITGQAGVTYNPLLDIFRISKDTDVNYMMTAVKNQPSP